MILIDSNVWIFSLDSRTPEHKAALAAIARAHDERIVVPAIVEIEVVHYATRRLQAGLLADTLAPLLAVEASRPALNEEVVRAAVALLGSSPGSGIGGRDAAILVHAQDAGANLLTADKALARAASRAGITAHGLAG